MNEIMKIQGFRGIHPTEPILGQLILNTDGNILDSKNDGFWFRSVNINLKQHGVGQKMMTGWHNHQGVKGSLKSADVIWEQPLKLPAVQANIWGSSLHHHHHHRWVLGSQYSLPRWRCSGWRSEHRFWTESNCSGSEGPQSMLELAMNLREEFTIMEKAFGLLLVESADPTIPALSLFRHY